MELLDIQWFMDILAFGILENLNFDIPSVCRRDAFFLVTTLIYNQWLFKYEKQTDAGVVTINVEYELVLVSFFLSTCQASVAI